MTRSRTAALTIAGVAAAGVLALAGCSKFTEPYKDAPRSGNDNGAAADLIRMPDGFSNVAAKCDGPNRIYVAYKGNSNRAALAVVAGDPRCTK